MQLEFVTAEEAAKWPIGTPILCFVRSGGVTDYEILWMRPGVDGRSLRLSHYDRFARLPDALPEVER